MTILFEKRIDGFSDNALLLGRFHGLTINNDDLGKSFLKKIIGSYIKVENIVETIRKGG